ncbi:peptidase [Streptomyces sp. NPDC059861]|uniref:peptidase n=1 Tax=Streptomyces sp. NPDC059861 TaxID=3346974 RepID=UPI0036526E37
MKFRCVLATAVAAAVTAPVVVLSAAPAFADEKPAARTQKAKPTIEELKQAVAVAQNEYDAAVIAVNDAIKVLTEDMEADTYPAKAAMIEAKQAAEAAAQVKADADQAVVDAQAELDAATTDEDRAAAQTALDEATKAAQEAAEAKTAADTEATEAQTAYDDARVAQGRKIYLLQKTRDEARTKLDDARKALADAEAEEGEEPGGECVAEPKLTAVVSGLPNKVVGGTTATFTLRVTNGTGKTTDEVYPYAAVHAFDAKGIKPLDYYLDLEWSTAANPTWRDADLLQGLSVGSLKARSSVDVKLRLKVDADVPAGQGAAFVSADYVNEDESCGGFPGLDQYEFQILAKGSDPGKVEDAEGKPGDTSDTTEQGGTSTTPVNNGSGGNGPLAETGSSDALPQVALAAGAALVLGAGTVVVARRRKAGTNA